MTYVPTEDFLAGIYRTLDDAEQRVLVKFYSEKFNTQINGNSDFYQLLLKLLPFNSQIENDVNFQSILSKAGLDKLNEDETLYLILYFTGKIYKLKKEELIDKWQHVWQPLEDDAVALFLPNRKVTLLVTHWDTIFFDTNHTTS